MTRSAKLPALAMSLGLVVLVPASFAATYSINSTSSTYTSSFATAAWSPALPGGVTAASDIIQVGSNGSTYNVNYTLNFTGSATNSAFTVGTIRQGSNINGKTWTFGANTTEGSNSNILTLDNGASSAEITASNRGANYFYSFASGLTLSLSSNLNIRMATAATGNTLTFAGPIVSTSDAAPKNITVYATGRSNGTGLLTTFSGDIQTGGTITVTDESGQQDGSVTFSGVIGSAAAAKNVTGLTVNYAVAQSNGNNGAGAFVTIGGTAGDNLYTGVTNVQRGLLSVAKNNGLGAGGSGNGTTVGSGGTLNFNMTGTYTNDEPVSLAGSGPTTGAFNGAGALRYNNAGAFTFGGGITHTAAATINTTSTNAASALTLSGVYDDAGFGLTKIGPAKLVLSNSGNTITGVTQIRAGTLALTAASGNSNLGSSSIIVGTTPAESTAVLDVTNVAGGFQVKSGQTLAGHGSVLGNSVTINSGALLAPGNSIGTLTLNNALTLAGSSVLEISRSGAVFTNDKVAGITGGSPDLTYGGMLTVSNIGPDAATSFVVGDSWDLFDGFTTYAGAFASQSLPTLSTGLEWNFNYATGLLSVQTAVPEPASVASLAMLAAAAGIRRRR